MLVFKEFENNEFSILDTEDNIIESISGEELLNILCTTDIEIKGLSLNSKGFVVDDTKTVLYKPVKAKNSNLNKAKKAKNDEFYTQLQDIEKELSHYPIETFKDKVIYCPCDSIDMSNGYISNFAIYFYNNFEVLGIKKLICTCYSDDINYFEYDGKTEIEDTIGSGDFRSEYCTKLLQEADIVVTNPPFSLFRDFIKWLVTADKKFIIVGNQNAFTYKEVFPLIKDNKLWTGTGKSYSSLAGYFQSPYEDRAVTGEHIEGQVRVSGVCWFTNVDHFHRHEKMTLLTMQDWKDTKGVEYPKYDNYDAIEVSKSNQIPSDYDGVIGVPISFLHKFSPDQFEILGLDKDYTSDKSRFRINNKTLYARILIRHRKDENGKLI